MRERGSRLGNLIQKASQGNLGSIGGGNNWRPGPQGTNTPADAAAAPNVGTGRAPRTERSPGGRLRAVNEEGVSY